AGEIVNQLNHMEVLLAAATFFEDQLRLPPWLCAPTTSSFPDRGIPFQYYYEARQTKNGAVDRIPDLQGQGYVLEAFGGTQYTNNGKKATDLDALRFLKQKYSGVRCFLAAPTEAFGRHWPVGARQTAVPPRRGQELWRVDAT